MATSITLSQAARLLGISLPTARKRLSSKYKGDDRIRGAKRVGRDWRIPRKEIERLNELELRKSGRFWDTKSAFAFGLAVLDELQSELYDGLVRTAEKFVQNAYDGESGDALRDLKTALKNYEELSEGGIRLIDSIAARVEDQDWLTNEAGYQVP